MCASEDRRAVLERRAAEAVLTDESLRRDLPDPAAEVLLAWALTAVATLAAQAARRPAGAEEWLADRVGQLRRLLRRLAGLAGRPEPPTPGEWTAIAAELRALGLPAPALTAELARRWPALDPAGRLSILLSRSGPRAEDRL